MNDTQSDRDFFAGLETVLDGQMPSLTYAEDSVIFSEGDTGTVAYLIEHGEIQITRQVDGTDRILATLGAGELLGEVAFLDHGQRSATATALVDSELVPINRLQLERAVTAADPLLQLLIQELTHRIRPTTRKPDRDTSAQVGARRQSRKRAIDEIRTQRELRTALKRHEFSLHFQPVVDIPGGRLLGFEALLRWLHPKRGMVPPFQFIDIAESTGLIVPIGLWVLNEACHFLKRVRSTVKQAPTQTPLFMSVNVSPRQLRTSSDVNDLVKALQSYEFEAGAIKLEVTEQALMQNPEAALTAMQTLKAAGASLSIDDFGTGYSSLSYLHRFPLDVLKIDRSFVCKLTDDKNTLCIVRAVIGLAQDLQLDIVAEGIEKPEETAVLVELGCRQAQGYLYSKPLAASDALDFMRAQSQGRAA